jgi:hypothetical protein
LNFNSFWPNIFHFAENRRNTGLFFAYYKDYHYICSKIERAMITIANPIYDVVFKYLMADERIARTILSALLQKEVLSVEVRPQEFVNDKNADITMLRIDFGATVVEADGSQQLTLIELQKTWLETETLRFRRYLATQYESPRNMMLGERREYALPMVAVYLLGHRIGDVEEPVLYVHHEVRDYNGDPVVKGLPNPFIDSLTHDSIIVQIPLLHGRVNTRLERVLSIFDQSHKNRDDQRLMSLDDRTYMDDPDMQFILHRLSSAASDPDVRRDMSIEEEFFSAIDRRDTDIVMRDHKLAEQTVQLREQKAQLSEQQAQLSEQQAQLSEQNAQLEKKDTALRNSVRLLSEMGIDVESIAQKLHIDPSEVNRLLVPHSL